MNKTLEYFLQQWNPKHDFDEIKFYNHIDAPTLGEVAKAQLKNLLFYPMLIKPIARGGVVGGAVGALTSYLAGDSPQRGFVFGAVLGAGLDYQQFSLRGLYHYIKAQHTRPDKPTKD